MTVVLEAHLNNRSVGTHLNPWELDWPTLNFEMVRLERQLLSRDATGHISQITWHMSWDRTERAEPIDTNQEPMTGYELLNMLAGLDDATLRLPVYSVGCDCTEASYGLTIDSDSIMIERTQPEQPVSRWRTQAVAQEPNHVDGFAPFTDPRRGQGYDSLMDLILMVREAGCKDLRTAMLDVGGHGVEPQVRWPGQVQYEAEAEVERAQVRHPSRRTWDRQ